MSDSNLLAKIEQLKRERDALEAALQRLNDAIERVSVMGPHVDYANLSFAQGTARAALAQVRK